jgi:flavin-binding protein dodecin
MKTKTALIVIGQYKAEWHTLAPAQQRAFIARVGAAASALGLEPITGYRLTSAPGTFMEVWEAVSQQAVERAVKNLEALGYARYVEARWLIGEREDTPRK